MGATEIVGKIKEEAVSEEAQIISEAKEKAKLKLEEAKAQLVFYFFLGSFII